MAAVSNFSFSFGEINSSLVSRGVLVGHVMGLFPGLLRAGVSTVDTGLVLFKPSCL